MIDSSNSSGVLEFTVNDEDISAFFPIDIAFASNHSFCGVGVAGVSAVDGAELPFSAETVLSTKEYIVV